MIFLTKLDGTEIVLNCDLIETIQEAPDTIIRLVNDKVIIVKEPMKEIIKRTIDYRKKVFSLIISESDMIQTNEEIEA